MIAVDLFAGPGGWDVAAHWLGVDPLGIEWDDAACRVREAAGLRTLQADVAALDPLDFPCDLLIASPPCTAFSMAGKGEGRAALDTLLAAVSTMGAGEPIDQAALDEACSDETAHLVLEPLRWALALEPRLICCEQVPPVLPVWEAMEPILRARGYATWSGVLSAEQYGVPQTRRRAFLIASLDGPVSMPSPSHQRYVAPRKRDDIGGGLFDLPESERIVAPGDGELLPWVSMAEALGWDDGPVPSPAPTVTSGGSDAGGVEVFASKGARERVGRSVRTSFGEPHRGPEAGSPTPEFDPDDRPSRTIVGKTGDWLLVNPYNRPNSAERSAEEPAPTVVSGNDFEERVWKVRTHQNTSATGERYERDVDEPSPTIVGRCDLWEVPAALDRRQRSSLPVEVDRPAPVITSKARSAEWVPAALDRRQTGGDVWVGQPPATTVAGDPRVHPPGHKVNADDEAAGREYDGRAGENAVRVTMEQAACLQSFPSGYPWEAAGSRSAAFRCIGNAVPPPMAQAVLREAIGGSDHE
jgi:DNA (cytosine-5)-methyltransferase 1